MKNWGKLKQLNGELGVVRVTRVRRGFALSLHKEATLYRSGAISVGFISLFSIWMKWYSSSGTSRSFQLEMILMSKKGAEVSPPHLWFLNELSSQPWAPRDCVGSSMGLQKHSRLLEWHFPSHVIASTALSFVKMHKIISPHRQVQQESSQDG